MRNEKFFTAVGIAVAVMIAGGPAMADGDAERGKRAFLTCVSCHSSEPDVHKTGPSLANIFGKKAGTIESFGRYSKEIKNSGIVWNDKTLDSWMRDPQSLIPGTLMRISGMKNDTERQDLIAFLKRISDGRGETAGGMQGGMGRQDPPDLKGLGPNNQVKSVTHCANTYDVTTQNGKTQQFWELNLRLKIDSSKNGPPKGAPVLIPGGMRGDRANLIFSSSEEISAFIQRKC